MELRYDVTVLVVCWICGLMSHQRVLWDMMSDQVPHSQASLWKAGQMKLHCAYGRNETRAWSIAV
jgi:hypothetical protein